MLKNHSNSSGKMEACQMVTEGLDPQPCSKPSSAAEVDFPSSFFFGWGDQEPTQRRHCLQRLFTYWKGILKAIHATNQLSVRSQFEELHMCSTMHLEFHSKSLSSSKRYLLHKYSQVNAMEEAHGRRRWHTTLGQNVAFVSTVESIKARKAPCKEMRLRYYSQSFRSNSEWIV